MNIQSAAARHEQMRIAGSLVDTDEHVEVFNPYTNKVVGTVRPRGRSMCAAPSPRRRRSSRS